MFAALYALFAGLLAAGAAAGGGGGGGSTSSATQANDEPTRDSVSDGPVAPVIDDGDGNEAASTAPDSGDEETPIELPGDPVPAPVIDDGDDDAVAPPDPASGDEEMPDEPSGDPAPAPVVDDGDDDAAMPSDPIPGDEETPDEPSGDPAPAPSGDTVYIPNVAESAYDVGWEGLSAEEQLLLEFVNAARLDPAGEAARQGVDLAPGVSTAAKQALAVEASLSAAADNHSEDMEAQNYFSHTGLDGSTPTSRAALEGYSGSVGENLGWVGSTALSYDEASRVGDHHQYLWASPEHQQNLLNGDWEVAGVGYAAGNYVYNGVDYQSTTFVTQKFGSQPENYLTGVVIDDLDGDAFYDIGEGQGQVKVTAFNESGVFTTETYSSGGYSLALDPGTYSVVFHGGALDGIYETEVSIGTQNVKLDVIEDNDAADVPLVTTDTVEEAITNNETLSYSGSEDLYLGELLEEAVLSAEHAQVPEGAAVGMEAQDSPVLSLILTEPSAEPLFDITEPYREEEADEDLLTV